MTPKRVGRIVSAIGERANVVVNKQDGKFASAHDLRRAFGTRWAAKVMPAMLKELMRHSSIETTLRYYVEFDADTLVRKLRTDVELAVREGRISYAESGRLLEFYEEGLHGYTYLEDPKER
jgi:integrase